MHPTPAAERAVWRRSSLGEALPIPSTIRVEQEIRVVDDVEGP